MKDNWLWDSKISDSQAKEVLRAPAGKEFIPLAALLLSRKNRPREVFKEYIGPLIFCRYWPMIKKTMRRNKWNEPRITFWQAIYERLIERYRAKGIKFRKEAVSERGPMFAEIGRKIAGLRKSVGLSQKKLAHKMGVSQQLVSRIEKGGENLSLTTLVSVARALNKKVEISLE
ncbi:MAG: helix-turn-helix transcriptional regulator [Candidatus Omnitrophica bacterium]|nr:helix-turn-helix transcriptional regulator [Candidatus Omnitrophota bacterium]